MYECKTHVFEAFWPEDNLLYSILISTCRQHYDGYNSALETSYMSSSKSSIWPWENHLLSPSPGHQWKPRGLTSTPWGIYRTPHFLHKPFLDRLVPPWAHVLHIDHLLCFNWLFAFLKLYATNVWILMILDKRVLSQWILRWINNRMYLHLPLGVKNAMKHERKFSG